MLRPAAPWLAGQKLAAGRPAEGMELGAVHWGPAPTTYRIKSSFYSVEVT